jgi:hypothetical protein
MKKCKKEIPPFQLRFAIALAAVLLFLGGLSASAKSGSSTITTKSALKVNTELLGNTQTQGSKSKVVKSQKAMKLVAVPGTTGPEKGPDTARAKSTRQVDQNITPTQGDVLTGGGDAPTSGGGDDSSGNGDGPMSPSRRAFDPGPPPLPDVTFAIVERKPDFRYHQPGLTFKPAQSSGLGQKRLGIGPGLVGNTIRYVPVGEF